MRLRGMILFVVLGLVAMPSSPLPAQSKTPAKPPAAKKDPAPSFPQTGTKPGTKSETKQPAPKKTDGSKPGEKKPAEKKPAKPKPPVTPEVKKQLDEWDALNQRRREIGRDIRFFQTKFSISSRADKLKIKADVDALVKEWTDKIAPKMRLLSVVKFRYDTDDTLVGVLLDEHPHPGEVVKALETYLKTDEETTGLLKAAAFANFKINHFERASELLNKARDKNPLGFDTSLPEEYERYVKYWKAEADLRRKEEAATGDQQLPIVEIETSRGKIKLVLYENQAPNTVANFIDLIEKKFYDEQHVHRVEPNFVIQAGDPTTKGSFDPKKQYGIGGPGYTIPCECFQPDARMHFRGSLSMAHAGRDTGGSQFFITLVPTPHLNPTPDGKTGHTVFGHVISGMDVVENTQRGDKIIKVTVRSKRKHEYKPRKVGDSEPDPKTKEKEKSKPETKKKESSAPEFPKTNPKKTDKTPTKTETNPPAKTTPEKTPAKTAKKTS